jgi:hypothetical protein
MNIIQPNGKSLIDKPKTLAQGLESFFSLFPKNISDDMKSETGFDSFLNVVKDKNNVPFDVANPSSMNFDTQAEISLAMSIAENHDKQKSSIYFK